MSLRRLGMWAIWGGLLASSPGVVAQQAKTPGEHPAAVTVPTPAKQRIETEIVTLERGGATPSQISRPAGQFYLEVENRIANPASPVVASGLELVDGVGLVVPKVLDLISLQRRRISISLVDLPAGDYQLRTLLSARVLCRIHIR
jgi:hypothetical protein